MKLRLDVCVQSHGEFFSGGTIIIILFIVATISASYDASFILFGMNLIVNISLDTNSLLLPYVSYLISRDITN